MRAARREPRHVTPMAIYCPDCRIELDEVVEKGKPRFRVIKTIFVLALVLSALYFAYGFGMSEVINARALEGKEAIDEAGAGFTEPLESLKTDMNSTMRSYGVPESDIAELTGLLSDIQADVGGGFRFASDTFSGVVSTFALGIQLYASTVGILYAVTAIGIWGGKAWAWRRLYIMTLINIPLTAILLLVGVAPVALVLLPISMMLIPLLLRWDVRMHYGIPVIIKEKGAPE